MPAGRPSTYDPAYCEQVVEFMAQGYSLTAFAGSIRVARSTVHEWMERHPEFADAVKTAHGARTATLEREMLMADSSPRVTARIFALKNAAPDEWRDRQHHEHTGKDGDPIETRSPDTADLAKALLSIIGKAAV